MSANVAKVWGAWMWGASPDGKHKYLARRADDGSFQKAITLDLYAEGFQSNISWLAGRTDERWAWWAFDFSGVGAVELGRGQHTDFAQAKADAVACWQKAQGN